MRRDCDKVRRSAMCCIAFLYLLISLSSSSLLLQNTNAGDNEDDDDTNSNIPTQGPPQELTMDMVFRLIRSSVTSLFPSNLFCT